MLRNSISLFHFPSILYIFSIPPKVIATNTYSLVAQNQLYLPFICEMIVDDIMIMKCITMANVNHKLIINHNEKSNFWRLFLYQQ